MRKTLVSLALSAALVSPALHADQKTLDLLNEAGVALTAEQANQILHAEGEILVSLIADLIAEAKDDADTIAAIIAAAIMANPDLAARFVEAGAATTGPEAMSQTVEAAAAAAVVALAEDHPDAVGVPPTDPTPLVPATTTPPVSSIPTAGTGGGSTPVASPK